VHVRAARGGKLMTLILTPGQQHEATAFEPLMERGAVKRWGHGWPKLRPHRVVGYRAYSSRKIRHYVRRLGLRYTIPRKRHESRARLISRLKQFRRLATRYEKRAENYKAMWIIAATLLWL
jgi:transposase